MTPSCSSRGAQSSVFHEWLTRRALRDRVMSFMTSSALLRALPFTRSASHCSSSRMHRACLRALWCMAFAHRLPDPYPSPISTLNPLPIHPPPAELNPPPQTLCSQVLTSNPLVESWAHFPMAKRRLLNLLLETKPTNLLLLSGFQTRVSPSTQRRTPDR